MLTIRQIFLYLDRSYVIAASGVRSLFEMGLQLFRTHLAAHPEVSHQPFAAASTPVPLLRAQISRSKITGQRSSLRARACHVLH